MRFHHQCDIDTEDEGGLGVGGGEPGIGLTQIKMGITRCAAASPTPPPKHAEKHIRENYMPQQKCVSFSREIFGFVFFGIRSLLLFLDLNQLIRIHLAQS